MIAPPLVQRQRAQLVYGIRGELLLHVSDVPQGLACRCTCPACGEPLIARKGPRKAHHFAHTSGTACSEAVETALHLAAKDILAASQKIVLPRVPIAITSHSWTLSPGGLFRLDDVQLEHRVGSVIPDVLALVRGHPLLIEIRVAHAVEDRKKQRILDLGISAVEIDLSDIAHDLLPADLACRIVQETERKEWLFNTKAHDLATRALSLADTFPCIHRHYSVQVDGCPLGLRSFRGRPYANVLDDCSTCEFLAHSPTPAHRLTSITCYGRRRVNSLERLYEELQK